MFKSNSLFLVTSLAALALLVVLSGGACSRNSNQGNEGESSSKYLTIKGSDTMVHLASTWAEAYMTANPGTEISVTGGGSGTGIAALINGTTDICASSRDIKEEEIGLARKQGRDPQEFVVARDGIAIVINPGNPVSELSMEQIAKIYTGAYTNWNQVGGPDHGIIVLSRESSSGTYVFFQEHVLGKKDFAPEVRLMPATSAIVQSVASDAWAIGYVGLGYALEAGNQVKMLSVKADESSLAVAPTEATVISGEYSISRPLNIYTAGAPSGLVKLFIDFTLSPAGQQIVQETGYVKVN